jgi:hypothetical protein
MENSAMKKLIGEDLPEIELVPEKIKDQTKSVGEDQNTSKYRNVGNDQCLDHE